MLFEPANDLAFAEGEFERRAPFRAVELGSIGQAAGIVDADAIAHLRFGHGCILEITGGQNATLSCRSRALGGARREGPNIGTDPRM